MAWPMVAAIGASAVASGIGSYLSSSGADKAADATRKGIDVQRDMYDISRKDFEPFLRAGTSGVDQLLAERPRDASNWFRSAGGYARGLEDYGANFQFDPTEPIYQQRLEQSQEGIDKILSSRGLFNSRPGMNMIQDSFENIQATEFDKQYGRGYSNLTDLFNMSTQLGGIEYSKLLDLAKIGQGAAGSAGQFGVETGRGIANSYSDIGLTEIMKGNAQADFVSGLGAMPLNYMVLSNMMGGGGNPSAGAGVGVGAGNYGSPNSRYTGYQGYGL